MVEVETWFQEEGRVAACRNWLIRDATSGRQLGRATRRGPCALSRVLQTGTLHGSSCRCNGLQHYVA